MSTTDAPSQGALEEPYYCTLAKTEMIHPKNVGAQVAMNYT